MPKSLATVALVVLLMGASNGIVAQNSKEYNTIAHSPASYPPRSIWATSLNNELGGRTFSPPLSGWKPNLRESETLILRENGLKVRSPRNCYYILPKVTDDSTGDGDTKTPSIMQRWGIPAGVTIGAGLLVYTFYSVRGR